MKARLAAAGLIRMSATPLCPLRAGGMARAGPAPGGWLAELEIPG